MGDAMIGHDEEARMAKKKVAAPKKAAAAKPKGKQTAHGGADVADVAKADAKLKKETSDGTGLLSRAQHAILTGMIAKTIDAKYKSVDTILGEFRKDIEELREGMEGIAAVIENVQGPADDAELTPEEPVVTKQGIDWSRVQEKIVKITITTRGGKSETFERPGDDDQE